MKRISFTYQFFASALSLFLFVGVAFPMGLHSKTMDNCSMQHMGMDHHSETGTMEHMADMNVPCDAGFSCMCSIEEAPVKTEVPAVSIQPLIVSAVVTESTVDIIQPFSTSTSTLQQDDPILDSGPPLFVLHQTFLN